MSLVPGSEVSGDPNPDSRFLEYFSFGSRDRMFGSITEAAREVPAPFPRLDRPTNEQESTLVLDECDARRLSVVPVMNFARLALRGGQRCKLSAARVAMHAQSVACLAGGRRSEPEDSGPCGGRRVAPPPTQPARSPASAGFRRGGRPERSVDCVLGLGKAKRVRRAFSRGSAWMPGLHLCSLVASAKDRTHGNVA